MKRHKQKIVFGIIALWLMAACSITDKKNRNVPFEKFKRTAPGWAYNNDIYVLNVRQFSTSGNFQVISRYVPRINAMNIGIYCLMPVQELGPPRIEGHMSHPYAIWDYYKLDPDIETETDMKWRIEQIKRQERRVIMEWPAAYVHHESPLVESHPEWFRKGPDGKINSYDRKSPEFAWFDYSNKEAWEYQAEAMKYWLSNFEIEGFRMIQCDSLPLELMEYLRWQCEMIKPVIFVADAPGGQYFDKAFDIVPSDDFYQKLVAFAEGNLPPSQLQEAILTAPRDTGRLYGYYTSDFELNATGKTPKKRFGKYRKTMAILALSMPGPFIMYNGQETTVNKVIPMTMKSALSWDKLGMETIYREMLRLHRHSPLMRFGEQGAQAQTIETGGLTDSVIAFCRTNGEDKIISLINLSSRDAHLTLTDSLYTDEFINLITQKRLMYVAGDKVVLRPLEAWVLEN